MSVKLQHFDVTFSWELFPRVQELGPRPEPRPGPSPSETLSETIEVRQVAGTGVSGNYDKVMPVPASLDQHITWWLNILNGHPKLFFKQTDFVIEIFTDASPTGWGAFAKGEKTHGFWPKSKSKEHINVLELWAAFYGLKSFANEMCNCRILLRLDNTTAVSNLNRMGGVKYEHLNRITNMIWDWCENRNIMLFASYINTRDNIEADKESRSMNIETEFELNSLAFNEIVDTFGLPQIDLFASNLNTKCATYVSWHRDPDCYAVDAFTISSRQFFFYAFPPFSLIPRE
ncbi:hypothetical protein NQ315_002691 [Exocentrus adspersus]|uniref:RNase H type-1 domain-containing protein n=1 Tax=Exocentrus adspersus TaxID=1586481 RepID=A0AAV8VI28_9CUCU|nr:hypothetical protein NQ315_002691 [Exocentrus adspersus]